jgi:SAM-dependent methyltransferase
MAAGSVDPFANYKAAQREAWSSFLPVEVITTIPAVKLVKFAQVAPGQRVLDVACGTGVVAVTAARRGAKVSGLDLSPVLLERAHYNASVAAVDIDFTEGDAEALPCVAHFRLAQEKTIGPLTKVVASLENDPAKLAKLRAGFEAMAGDAYDDNAIRMPFLMTRATKA